MKWVIVFLALLQAVYLKARVQRVVDGDTWDVVIELRNDLGADFHMRIRLLDVNCAELRSRVQDERADARLQKAELESLLPKGQIIVLYDTQGRDSFGRLLSRARIGSLDIGTEMLKRGCKLDVR